MKATQKKSAHIAIVKPRRVIAAKRASANRQKQGAMAIYEFSDCGTKESITSVQFPAGVSDAEKVELAVALVKSQDVDFERQRSQARYHAKWQSEKITRLEKKLKAALVMIRDFDLMPVEDEEIPF